MPDDRVARWFPVRRIDVALWVTLALCLFAWWPVLASGGLPEGHDTLFHLHRAAEMNRSWSHGVLLPHWAETFYYGYGSPVFHYYAGLVYDGMSGLARVLGLSMFDSARALILIALPGAGVGTYLFARQRLGRLAGMIAAVCYVYSPYILYREPYVRGDYPELLAFALFPFVLWRFERLALAGRGRDFAVAALLLSVFMLSHNLMAAALGVMLGGWIVWGRLVGVLSWPRAGLLVAAAGVGVLGAMHFWLPMILERDAVHLDRLIGIPSLDYRNSFVPLRQMLAFVPRTDVSAVNGLRAMQNLGVAQWALALAGVLSAAVLIVRAGRRGWARVPAGVRLALYFAAVALVLIGLMLPGAAGLWDAVDVIAYLQFPWRLLGPVAFCLAMLAGLNARWIERLAARRGAVIVVPLLVAPVALSMPLWQIADRWRLEAVDTSIGGYFAVETSGELPGGTTVTNEFLPKDVFVIPSPTQRLLEDYADGYPVDRLHRSILPDDAQVTLLGHGPERDDWRVETPDGVTLEVLTFYFEGWTARVDGEETPITPSQPHGLITFQVPPGTHTVRLALEPTPVRRVAAGLSLAALIAAVGGGVWLARHPLKPDRPLTPTPIPSPIKREGSPDQLPSRSMSPIHQVPFPSRVPVARMGAAALVVVAVLAAIFMREGGAWVRSAPGEARLAQHHVYYRLGDDIELLGYDIDGAVEPGGRLDVTLYWRTLKPFDRDYNSFLHFSTGGPPLAQVDKLNPGDLIEWSTDGFVRDEYVLQLPDTLPPGDYQLRAGLWTCDGPAGVQCTGDGERLAVVDAAGAPVGDAVLLDVLTVRARRE